MLVMVTLVTTALFLVFSWIRERFEKKLPSDTAVLSCINVLQAVSALACLVTIIMCAGIGGVQTY